MKTHTENIILQAWASIKIITGGPLLEATRVRNLKLQFIGKGRHLEMLRR